MFNGGYSIVDMTGCEFSDGFVTGSDMPAKIEEICAALDMDKPLYLPNIKVDNFVYQYPSLVLSATELSGGRKAGYVLRVLYRVANSGIYSLNMQCNRPQKTMTYIIKHYVPES